jgi:cell fate regulator YaaT (PSP1 superfamily)
MRQVQVDVTTDTESPGLQTRPQQLLVRYGAIPVVARCVVDVAGDVSAPQTFQRGQKLVIKTSRGTELADVLQTLSAAEARDDVSISLVRRAVQADLEAAEKTRIRASMEFPEWKQRIAQWGLQLELIDLEWTLDEQKTVLYVLNSRGPDTTKLAIQAAASGMGLIEVQPVDANGMVEAPPGGGGGCGSCSH